MLCQNCQKNEADRVFVANWMGRPYQMHICDECLSQMWQYAAAGNGDAFRGFAGWWPGRVVPREIGEDAFPQDAGDEVKRKRRLNALRYRLEEAAGREDYEEAARLRDRIAAMEREEYSHES